jgi:hypothetical protein
LILGGQAIAREITIPPATISEPPRTRVIEGVCLKKSQEINCAMTKNKTTYKPRSFPKSHGGAFTVDPYAKRIAAAPDNST